MLLKIRQIWQTTCANFRRWRRNPQILLAFGIGFVISFLLSGKVLEFAQTHDTILQILEPFIWTFGDAVSILTISLCLLLLFADMPNLGNEVPFFLIRTTRNVWMLGQILYMVLTTFLFLVFILISTCVLAGAKAYPVNLWSDTAAILGYSEIGKEIAIPAFVKVLELSFPYTCMLHIFGLLLGYSLVLAGIILYLNLWSARGGMVGGIIFSAFGFVISPEILSKWLDLSKEQKNIANIIFGWISPLNHATYYMHNFGYDNLPKLWESYVFFLLGIVLIFGLAMWKIRTYPFDFTGTQK